MGAQNRQFKGVELDEVIEQSMEANSELAARLKYLVTWIETMEYLPPEQFKESVIAALETAKVGV